MGSCFSWDGHQRNLGWGSAPSWAWGKEEKETKRQNERMEFLLVSLQALSSSDRSRESPLLDRHCREELRVGLWGHSGQKESSAVQGLALDGSSQCQELGRREASGEKEGKILPMALNPSVPPAMCQSLGAPPAFPDPLVFLIQTLPACSQQGKKSREKLFQSILLECARSCPGGWGDQSKPASALARCAGMG